jgi:catecholate siderophore receptor
MKHRNIQRKTRRGWESRLAWKLVAQATVLSTMGAIGVNATAAQTPSIGGAGPSETQSAKVDVPTQGQRNFDIAPGELTSALDAFGHATGFSVHSTIPSDKLVGFRSKGVQGIFTPEQALQRLLADTGLSAHFEGENKVEIGIRDAQRVDVTASVAQLALQQFPQPLVDTAQTVNVIPQYILSEQADTSLRDSLRNVPGISIAAGEGG